MPDVGSGLRLRSLLHNHTQLRFLAYVKVHMSKKGPGPTKQIMGEYVKGLERNSVIYAQSIWINGKFIYFCWILLGIQLTFQNKVL